MFRDGLALDLSIIGNKELGFAFLPYFAGASQVLNECPSDKESAQHPICLVVHGRHIDGPRHNGLCVDLGEEPQSHEECYTSIGKS